MPDLNRDAVSAGGAPHTTHVPDAASDCAWCRDIARYNAAIDAKPYHDAMTAGAQAIYPLNPSGDEMLHCENIARRVLEEAAPLLVTAERERTVIEVREHFRNVVAAVSGQGNDLILGALLEAIRELSVSDLPGIELKVGED